MAGLKLVLVIRAGGISMDGNKDEDVKVRLEKEMEMKVGGGDEMKLGWKLRWG